MIGPTSPENYLGIRCNQLFLPVEVPPNESGAVVAYDLVGGLELVKGEDCRKFLLLVVVS